MSDSLYTIHESYARYSLTDEAYEKIREYLPKEKVTRAKYRLYVIGARDVWKHSYWVNKMMTIMDEENMV